MTILEHAGRLYEFTILSPTGTSDWIVECHDVSEPDGFFGSITVRTSGDATLRFFAPGELPVEVLSHWLSMLPPPMEEGASDD